MGGTHTQVRVSVHIAGPEMEKRVGTGGAKPLGIKPSESIESPSPPESVVNFENRALCLLPLRVPLRLISLLYMQLLGNFFTSSAANESVRALAISLSLSL